MAKTNQDTLQFGSAKPASMGGSALCAQTEAMLADALDGTLEPGQQAQFDQHLAGCVACQQMLADAQRGAAFLELLRSPRPEPSAALLERILLQTAAHPLAQLPTVALPPSMMAPAGALPMTPANVLPFPRRLAGAFNMKNALSLKGFGQTVMQPRLAMTAAMAFFSIGLTLNLTGVRLNELNASDLKPSSVRRGISNANVRVVRYVDNLRVVYELESRVRDLQRSSDAEEKLPPSDEAKPAPSAQPDTKPKQSRPRSGSGSSSRRREPFAPLTVAVSPGARFRSILEEGESV